MSDENKAVVRAFLMEVIGSHDADARPDLIAPGYVSHFGSMPPLDHEGWKQMAGGFFTAFPDLELTIQDEVAEGDRVAVRWTWTGTHTGDLMGMAPTGKHVETGGMGVYRVVDGQIAEEWVLEDMMGVMQQLSG